MNRYEVHCIMPRPIERIEAEHSFAARREYAERHGVGLTDCYAKRIWEDGTLSLVGVANPESGKVKWPREKPIRNVPSLAKYIGETETDVRRTAALVALLKN